MPSSAPAVLSLFSIHPTRIGGTETFARELPAQIGAAGWQSVLSTLSAPPEPGARWKRVLRRLADVPITGIVSVSDSNRAFQAALGAVPPGRIVRVYNAVDLTRTHDAPPAEGFRRRHGIPADRRLVVQGSMVIPERGVGDLLAAAAIVAAQEPAAHFVFVGEGRARASYAQSARRAGIGDHVTFTGPLLDPVAEGVFAEADVVCQVSRWEEAFGWTIIEGMSFGKPVVGARVGGIPELIQDGVTGYLTERGNVQQIASLVLSVLRDPDEGDRMGRAARAAVEARFDLRANVRQLVDLYGIS